MSTRRLTDNDDWLSNAGEGVSRRQFLAGVGVTGVSLAGFAIAANPAFGVRHRWQRLAPRRAWPPWRASSRIAVRCPGMKLPPFISSHIADIERELDRITPPESARPQTLHRAMRYTLFAPSKRVRAVLTLLAADVCGNAGRALPVAAAIELVHASSLILDDLPALDNADLRRGRPSNHVAHGEAMALMAAFNLFNLAFGTIANEYDAPLARQLTALIAASVGSEGVIGGEVEDLLATETAISFEALELIHRWKTGALFVAAATAGALTAGGRHDQVAALAAYAKNLGLAFQIIDDLLDVEGDPAETGKPRLADARKTTFVSFSGVSGARQLARELCQTATRALDAFGPRADRLRDLAEFVSKRHA
jgi:geranylgeranyl diphosphate synthase type II